jgi:hypothetical protein
LAPILMKSPFLRFKITIFLEHRFSQKLLRMFFPKDLPSSTFDLIYLKYIINI